MRIKIQEGLPEIWVILVKEVCARLIPTFRYVRFDLKGSCTQRCLIFF